MIQIENTFSSAIIYADSIDTGAEGLIRALCGSPISKGSKIRIMPDVHAGKGCTVGTTMTIGNCVAPGLVGVDIGCGVLAVKLDKKRLELQKLDKLIRQKVPSGTEVRQNPHRFAEQADLEHLRCLRHIQTDKARNSIGTLGGGNHFIEVDRNSDDALWLIIHSGSRHLGVEVANYYQKMAYETSPEGTPYELAYLMGEHMEDYLHDMAITETFAALNRRAIADEILRGMKLEETDSIHSVHNYIDTQRMILRKGAISAEAGQRVIIPMNMRDGCLIGIGKGNPDWNYSAPHGAGRLMSRAESRNNFTLSQYKKEMAGIYSTSVCRETLDESPMAYKAMDGIVKKIKSTAEVNECWTPGFVYKG